MATYWDGSDTYWEREEPEKKKIVVTGLYRSYYKEKLKNRDFFTVGGICHKSNLKDCIQATVNYLKRKTTKEPFVIYSEKEEKIVYDSETTKELKDCATFIEYDNLKGQMEMAMEKTLYEIKNGELVSYGFKLATNSQGQWVMELKGSGDVVAVDKKNVTEVMPYTVAVKYKNGGQLYHYFDENRTVKKGDILVVESALDGQLVLVQVTDLDTKAKTATKEISFLKNLGGVDK